MGLGVVAFAALILGVLGSATPVRAATPGSFTVVAQVTLPTFPSPSTICVALGGSVSGEVTVGTTVYTAADATLYGQVCYSEPNCPPTTGSANGNFYFQTDHGQVAGNFAYARTGTAAVISTSGDTANGNPFDNGTGAGSFAITGAVNPASLVPPCPPSSAVAVTVTADISFV
ncbi:MAG: hypothetical protein ACYDAC_12810 [Candidatus Dormibacteria bacterium]